GGDVEVAVGAGGDVVGDPDGLGVGLAGQPGDGARGEVEVDDPVGQRLGQPGAAPAVESDPVGLLEGGRGDEVSDPVAGGVDGVRPGRPCGRDEAAPERQHGDQPP